MGLLGPVRSIRIEAERPVTTAAATTRVPVQNLVFDEKGNVLHQDMYKPDGTLNWKLGWGHVYDDQGREIKTYYYNAEGVLTNTGVSVYDKRGRLTETTQINPNGTVNHIRAFFYDEKDNKIRESHRDLNGNPLNDIRRGYDANGRMIEETYYAADGSLYQKNVFTYDDHGNETSWTVARHDETSAQMFRKDQRYDEHGNVKETVSYLDDGSLRGRETFTYDLDERRNWIKRTTSRELFKESRSQLESEVTYRTITYF